MWVGMKPVYYSKKKEKEKKCAWLQFTSTAILPNYYNSSQIIWDSNKHKCSLLSLTWNAVSIPVTDVIRTLFSRGKERGTKYAKCALDFLIINIIIICPKCTFDMNLQDQICHKGHLYLASNQDLEKLGGRICEGDTISACKLQSGIFYRIYLH